jgi:predicted SAM-dependent methyltransferase
MAKTLRGVMRQTARRITRFDTAITRQYFVEHKTRKLHLGCGNNLLSGWLNSDLEPSSRRAIRIDVTKRFPFADATFDYVFSEHMIEHIPYAKGMLMLRECFRVTKPGGRIRISTPDLTFLMQIRRREKSELQQAYIRWATEHFIPDAPVYDETFVINNFVRNWGHAFIYDERVMRYSLAQAGFGNILRCDLRESDDPQLRQLENERRMPEGFVRLESFTLEASRPR